MIHMVCISVETAKRLVADLTSMKPDHYQDGGDGLNSCESYYGRACDCDAPETNAMLDRDIEQLRFVLESAGFPV